eukprot:COSAG01_NODE_381_length_17848_cov_10.220338_26_plen_59_part_01
MVCELEAPLPCETTLQIRVEDSQEGSSKEINWEEELSLGEKQRLAIARLIHHKPQFAVL